MKKRIVFTQKRVQVNHWPFLCSIKSTTSSRPNGQLDVFICEKIKHVFRMIVLKFGGSSVGSPETIEQVVDILEKRYRTGEQFAVVFSAFSKVTDSLIECAHRAASGDKNWDFVFEKIKKRHFDAIEKLLKLENRAAAEAHISQNFNDLGDILHGVFLVKELSPRTLDVVVSFGERNSSFIVAQAMSQRGIPSGFLDARLVVRTDENFGAAKVEMAETERLIQHYFNENPKIQSITGFIGSTAAGQTTTLGRGGSDFTAAIFGAALSAEAIEIWTDVDGVLTCDPRRVKKAFSLPTMTYREAMEMSHFGAKVIYPPTILPALARGIPLLIKNTFNPEHPGTFISEKAEPSDFPIKGISSIGSVALVTLQGGGLAGVPGTAARLFGALGRAAVNIILITQGSSELNITFAVLPNDWAATKRAVEHEFSREIEAGLIEPLKITGDYAVIAVVGEGMSHRPGIAGQIFTALGKNGVNIAAIAQGSSELNVSLVIQSADETKALNAIHEAFFLSDTRALNLFMVGVGLIGSTLLEQIQRQAAFLKERRKLEIRVVGLANSTKMIFNENGIDLDNWKTQLVDSQSFTMPSFIAEIKKLNLPSAIFVDNTASAEVASFYETLLDSSISISTPNKIAPSSSFLQYERLKKTAERRGVQFRYETNVGAGLPILSTLEDLMTSGDRILKIEGILSGTLSFIFNNFKEKTKFSDIVAQAKQRGLTEPDPRIDLSGKDVARKLLILARESGLALEPSDIEILPFLPKECLEAASIPDFMKTLEDLDGSFEAFRVDFEKQGKKPRMIAKLENGRATIGLEGVDVGHPFFHLDGSDNMVVFTTERYRERPLVVRGPGAGAEVTAAGVFAEVVSIGNFLK
jgi:bifunctional aspartokinase / homoserine dehydrogenase 1